MTWMWCFSYPSGVILQVKQSGGKIRPEDIVVRTQLQDGPEYPHTGDWTYFQIVSIRVREPLKRAPYS